MAPQSVARGVPRKRGIGQRRGMPDRAQRVHVGRQQPATGSHLPLEDRLLWPFAGHDTIRVVAFRRIPSRKAAVAPAEICSAVP